MIKGNRGLGYFSSILAWRSLTLDGYELGRSFLEGVKLPLWQGPFSRAGGMQPQIKLGGKKSDG